MPVPPPFHLSSCLPINPSGSLSPPHRYQPPSHTSAFFFLTRQSSGRMDEKPDSPGGLLTMQKRCGTCGTHAALHCLFFDVNCCQFVGSIHMTKNHAFGPTLWYGSTDSATIHTHSISHLYRSQRCLVLPPPSLSTAAGRTAKTPQPMSAADANMSGTVDALANNMTGLCTNVTAQDSQLGH
jgi:hypothetical protein